MEQPITIEPVRWQTEPARITIRPNGGRPEIYYQTIAAINLEAMCLGRPAEELPRILPIAGPAHHLAAALALDDLFGVAPPPMAANIREGMLLAQTYGSHLRKLFFLLSSQTEPFADFRTSPRRPASIASLHRTLDDAMHHIALAQEAETILGGRNAHPLTAVAGGVSRFLKEGQYERLADIGNACLDLASRLAENLHTEVFDPDRMPEIFGATRIEPPASLTLQADNGTVALGIDAGEKADRFPVSQVFEKIGLHTEPWTRHPFAYIRDNGWSGRTGQTGDSLCFAGPLARLNHSTQLAAPLAEQERRLLADQLGPFPLFGAAAGTWSLLVELIQSAERMTGLFRMQHLTGPAIRTFPTEMNRVGHGAVESPEGVVFHEYRVDDRGIVDQARILDTTVLNNAMRCRLVEDIVGQALEEGLGRSAVKERVERSLLPF
jgi:F420-non-reducing hydrogenase large subunit